MTEDKDSKPVEETATAAATATAARQRKKRKWDQPAESLISVGLSVTGSLPLGMGGTVGILLPGAVPSSVIVTPVSANPASACQAYSVSQNSAAVIQKLTQPKIQDELIAREIVINDAEATIRYKLTKRQTQEEIQRSTGAVVITRGKYRPPNALPDSEKPLYLHISAGAHLKDTAERIKAVDLAAAMVEDILKQGQNSLPAAASIHSTMTDGQATQPLSACLYLGFETDPSLNIAARIRGPNDMYINHIMNETGASVVLRGRGSGTPEHPSVEEAQQPLHLYLSSSNPRSLEAAKGLAENLLDTISTECGASRISSCKVYSAVPPPQQLLSGVQSSGEVLAANSNPVARQPAGSTLLAFASAVNGSTGTNVSLPGSILCSGVVPNYSTPQPHMAGYPYPSVTGGTCYSGYGGIYPQATPLQQVALALRKAPASAMPGVALTSAAATGVITSSTSAVSVPSKTTSSSITEAEKRPSQKRKFQELSAASSKDMTAYNQNLLEGSECLKPGYSDTRNVSTMPPPKKLVQTESHGMPRPPPPRIMPPPPPKLELSKSSLPPPPKFASPGSTSNVVKIQDPVMIKTISGPVPDTLLKLVEYGEDDDDIDAPGEEYLNNNLARKPSSKPFWAV